MIHVTRTTSRTRYAVVGEPAEVERQVGKLKAGGAWELDRVPLRDGRLLVQLSSLGGRPPP